MAAKSKSRSRSPKKSARTKVTGSYRFALFMVSIFTLFLVLAISLSAFYSAMYVGPEFVPGGYLVAAAVLIYTLFGWLAYVNRRAWSWWVVLALPIFFTVMGLWSLYNSLLVSTDYIMLTQSLDVPILIISMAVIACVIEPAARKPLTS